MLIRFRLLLIVVMFMVCLSASTAAPQTHNSIAGELANAFDQYVHTQFEGAIDIADRLFQRPELTVQDSLAVYEVLCVCAYAKGPTHHEEAFSYLTRMADLGPCVIPLPHDFWPRELQDRWWHQFKSTFNTLTCPREYDQNVRTIAIMPFDNLSIGQYKESLSLLGSSLSEFFAYNFSAYSDLDIVERNQLDYLIREQKLVRDSLVDAATAIRLGKLLGAQLMVFGSISQYDKDEARLLVRVVDVETGRVLTMISEEGKPHYSKMVRKSVEEVADKLELQLDNSKSDRLKQGGTDSMDALQLYTRGLDYMDKYDYSNAYEFFKKAYEADNHFIQAREKMKIYQPLVG